MPDRKIVVCSTEAEANAQRLVLERDHYTAIVGPARHDRIVWDATPANGAIDIRTGVWVVEGTR